MATEIKSFQDQYELAQELSGLTDATSLIKFKRDINKAGTMFLAKLGREYTRKSRTTNLVADQQYYQLPEDALRISNIIATSGGFRQPLEQIPDEQAWRYMNMTVPTGQPTHFFIRGFDEVGLYPMPSANVTDGLEIVFEPKHVLMTAADVTGTATVTNGSVTVTDSATSFTQSMISQQFQVTDGTDGRWYRISAFTSTSIVSLENYFQGLSGSKTYRIGQVMDIPDELMEGPVDYALFRHYLKRGDTKRAAEFRSLFESALEMGQELYSNQTSSQVINAEASFRSYNPWRGDSPPSITA